MSFIKRAQDAAVGAAEAAKVKAGEAAAAAHRTASDPATQERLSRQARDAAGFARRSVTTVVERIDPSTLAEVIIRATALQEHTNAALREKASPYRISEIAISASIPPGVTFVVGRIDDRPEVLTGTLRSSEELIELENDPGDLVIALDGTTVEDAAVDPIEAPPGAMPPTTISTG